MIDVLQKCIKNVEKSGEHAEHKWSFCSQKYYVQLMMDWYELRGGDSANPFCKQYFSVQLDSENGEAFNTLDMDQPSSGSEDEVTVGAKRKQPAKPARRSGRSGKSQANAQDLVAGMAESFKNTGDTMAKALTAIATSEQPTMHDLVRGMNEARKEVDDLDDQLDDARKQKKSKRKIQRLRETRDAAEEAYQDFKQKVQDARGGRQAARRDATDSDGESDSGGGSSIPGGSDDGEGASDDDDSFDDGK